MNSYGDDDDDDGASSSDSEDEILKQFEISVSRSQSFRSTANGGGGGEAHHQQQQQQTTSTTTHTSHLSLGRRHKFTRLSDQEEGSTEPSDCEGVVLKETGRSQLLFSKLESENSIEQKTVQQESCSNPSRCRRAKKAPNSVFSAD